MGVIRAKSGFFRPKLKKKIKISFSHIRRCVPNIIFGLSTNWSFETLGVAFVRPFVRPYVRAGRFFSESVHYFFLNFYMKLGFKKLGKMFQALF